MNVKAVQISDVLMFSAVRNTALNIKTFKPLTSQTEVKDTNRRSYSLLIHLSFVRNYKATVGQQEVVKTNRSVRCNKLRCPADLATSLVGTIAGCFEPIRVRISANTAVTLSWHIKMMRASHQISLKHK